MTVPILETKYVPPSSAALPNEETLREAMELLRLTAPQELQQAIAAKDTAIGYATGAQVFAKFCDCLAFTVMHCPRIGVIISSISGPALNCARQDVLDGFLGLPDQIDKLLFVDTDMIFQPEDVLKLLRTFDAIREDDPQVGVLTGLYVDNNVVPVLGDWTPDGGYKPPSHIDLDNGPFEVGMCGFGFCVLTRDLFRGSKRLPARPFEYIPVSGGRTLGEDASFCSRVNKIGYKVFCEPSIELGHCKTRAIFPSGDMLK